MAMVVGVPKEIKVGELRVAAVPGNVQTLVANGHRVLIEKNAGLGSGISDVDYTKAGADIVDTAEEVWRVSDMIIKIKEPMSQEVAMTHKGQIIYTYLHLAANHKLIHALLEKEVTAVAYETIELEDGSLPLLTPMSEVAWQHR